MSSRKIWRRVWRGGIALVALAALAGGAWRARRAQAATSLAAAPVRKGDFLVIVRCRGELKARRSVQLTAPVNVPDLQIVWLAPAGDPVKKGEPVIRFDPSSARQQLQEKEAGLNQAQATLDQALAQAKITSEQDKLDLASAKYDVEKARLETSKAEIVSALQGEESKIDLGLAEQKLRVQDATVKLHEASDKAKIASLTRLRDQAQAEVDLTKHRIAQMEITAPSDGVIIYLSNYSQGWVNAKPFKVGDHAWPGGALAEIPDLSTLEMEGKVEEIDRGRIAAGQSANVHVDAFPVKTLTAKLLGISPLTEQSFEWPPTRSFRGYAQLDQAGLRLRPGMNGGMDVVVNKLPNALSIPAKALFTRDGKPIVYVADKKGYSAKEVELLARNPDEVAIKGVEAGTMVTLVEPAMDKKP
jgi:HlyD family secretion protein